MSTLAAHGISAALPERFEGHIFRRASTGGAIAYPVAHFATVPLSADRGDFGSGVVTLLGPTDVFVVLLEYGPESLGRALFARDGMPRRLSPGDFRPYVLRRGLGGQSGTQWFFTEGGRPFTLYGVLGSHRLGARLVPEVNRLLAGISIDQMAPLPALPALPGGAGG